MSEVEAALLEEPPRQFDRERLPPPRRPDAAFTILDITKYFAATSGGIRTYLLRKAAYVEAHPALRQVLVVPGTASGFTETDGVRCYHLRGPAIPSQRPYRFLLNAGTVRRILTHERPDLVEVGSPFLVPWVVRWANRQARIPLVWFSHSVFPRMAAPDPARASRTARGLERLGWSYVRRLSRGFRATLVGSEATARLLRDAGVRDVRAVPLGVELDRFRPERRAERGAVPLEGRYALFVGRVAREKALDTVLRAWPIVEARTGVRLVIVGDGPSRRYYRAMDEAAGVTWLPHERNRDRLADLLAGADLYVAPGPVETFGLSAVEALASGTPVVSVDQGAVADHVIASGAGATYPVGDSAGMAEAASGILRAPRPPLAARARAYAERHCGWEPALDRLFDLYRQVAGGEHAR